MKSTKTLVASCWTALSACILLTPLEAAWGPVTTVSPDPVSSFQQVGIDNFCRTTATWQQFDPIAPNVTNVLSSFLPQGGSWTSPFTVDTIPGTPAPSAFPFIFVNPIDPNGYGVGVWTGFNSGTLLNEQRAATEFLGSWSSPLLTSNGQGGIVQGLNAINVNNNGYAVVYFAARPGGPGTDFTVYSSTLAEGDPAWSPDLPAFSFRHFSFSNTIDQSNNAFLVHQKSLVFGTSVSVPLESIELPFGASSWNSPLTIVPSAIFGSQASAIDFAGNLTAVFAVDTGGGTNALQSSTLRAGETSWSAPLTIATNIVLALLPSPALGVVAPIIGVNQVTGDAVVIFETLVGGVNTIKSSSLPFGGSEWTTPITVSSTLPSTDANFFAAPSLGIDYCGNAYLAWPNLENGVHVIQASILPAGGTAWTTPVTVSTPGVESAFPFLFTNGEGYTVVTWVRDPLGESIIESSVWTPAATAIFSITPDCHDNQVTINGEGFCGLDFNSTGSVTIGGVEADFTVVSANTIIATVPSGAGAPCTTVPVVIQGGCTEGPVFGELTLAPSPPSDFVGRIKKEEHKKCVLKKEKEKCHHGKCKIKEEKKRKCTLKATWKASPCKTVVSYNIYKGDKIVATIPASGKLEFKTKLHHCKAKGFSITAVSKDCQESAHVPLKIKD
ncbi:MAG: hypothetical protein C5B43_01040 [Verrucomicrobia bacterium]|nr:MAG: hypothetical protein C5B43_01040 [Verrucomicrobiota bacterium]